jgi:hypothetical protein
MTDRSRKIAMDRRRFLTAIGATALTAPLLNSLPSLAQSADEKRYLVLLFTSNGIIRHKWGADVTGPGPGEFTLRPFLEKLTPFKDKLIVLDGLAAKAAQGSHEAGMASLWTGTISSGQLATGKSIDQLVAEQCGAGTAFKSIELMARAPEDYQGRSVQTRMCYSGDQQPLDPRDEPHAAFDSLFAGVSAMPAMPGDPLAPPPPDRNRIIRQNLLSHLDGELGELAPRLCNEDRHQLDALREGWNSLATRLNAPISVGGSAACSPSTPVDDPMLTGLPLAARQQMDILAMALACDLTRVASLQYSHALSPAVFSFLGQQETHHDLSHQQPQPYQVMDLTAPTAAEQAQYAPVWDKLTAINVWYSEQVAYLAQRLAEIPYGDRTLLDQTAICWGNELDNGSSHDHVNHPFVIVGGAGGKLKTGQVLKFAKDARAHNDLLVTLAAAMGCGGITEVGEPMYNTGPIAELLV